MYSACLAKSSFAAVVVVAPVVFWVIFNATRKHWRNKENTSARLRWRTEEEVEDIILSEARICDFERYNCVNIREKNFQILFKNYYVHSSSSDSSSKFAAAYICFVNTGLVDRVDLPPGMMSEASTSSPDKSSMTSEFSESESAFFFFDFLSFFCFFFFGCSSSSSSSSVLSASSWTISRERKSASERERERERECVCVCVCVCERDVFKSVLPAQQQEQRQRCDDVNKAESKTG